MADFTVSVRLQAIVDGYRSSMQAARADTRRFGAQATSTVRDSSQSFRNLGMAAAGVGAAATFGLVKASQAALGFQTSITKMRTQVGLSRVETDQLADSAIALGSTGRGPAELADALFFVTSAGLRGAKAVEVLEASAKAAAIGMGDAATVADLVTSAVNAYGPEVIGAAEATDTLIATIREGKAEAPALAGAIGRVLPVAAQMGVTFDQVGAAVAAMTRSGTNADEAVTQLRAAMLSLLKPTTQAEEALGQYGLSSSGLRDVITRDGLFAALTMVKEAIGDNDEAMARIFPNVRALAGVLDLTGASAEVNAGIFDRLTNSTGLLEAGYADWSSTAEASVARFGAAIKKAATVFGQTFLPVLTVGLDVATAFVGFIASMPGPVRAGAVALTILAGAVGLVGGALLLLLPRVVATKDALKDLRGSTFSLRNTMVGGVGVAAAFAAVTFVIGRFIAAKAEAKRQVDALASTLDVETGALTANTRAHVTNRLEQEGVLAAADALGISLGGLTNAALGNRDAQAAVAAAVFDVTGGYDQYGVAVATGVDVTKEQFEAARDVEKGIGAVAVTLGDAREASDRMRRATEDTTDGIQSLDEAVRKDLDPHLAALAIRYGTAGSTAAGFGDDLDDLEGDVDAVTEALEDQLDALLSLSDPLFALRSASVDVADAQKVVNDLVAKGKKGTDEHTDAVIDLADARLTEAAAARAATGALADEGATLDDVIDSILGVLEATGASADELAVYEAAMRAGGLAAQELTDTTDEALSGLLTVVEAKALLAAEKAIGVGRNIGQGIGQGIDESTPVAEAAVEGTVIATLAAANRAAQTTSPSRLFADEVGAMISAGIAVGIDDAGDLPGNAVAGVIDDAASRAMERVGQFLSLIRSQFAAGDAEAALDDAQTRLDALEAERRGLPAALARSLQDVDAAEAAVEAARAAAGEVTAAEQVAIERAQETLDRTRALHAEGQASAAEVTLAEERLAAAVADSTAATNEQRDAERALAEALDAVEAIKARATVIADDLAAAERAVARATLDVVDAEVAVAAASDTAAGVVPALTGAFVDLATAAGLSSESIATLLGMLGQVPAATAAASGATVGRVGTVHTVAAGDTLSGIAAANDVTLDAVVAANPHITNPNLIRPGDQISIPALQHGGIVHGSATGTLVRVGENFTTEQVTPISRNGVALDDSSTTTRDMTGDVYLDGERVGTILLEPLRRADRTWR